ncbi:uncharacterized protein C1orf112 [Patella vulgata]|uniref:uncharacterized protein C1orf112 n=1 Tax=Patella vulgata TaxID=6465 RepID=UPI00218086D2|nr:uncharacterized protein C1orf112 [Patella vulgata]
MEASQTDLLAEVAALDLDQCKERFQETLPKVIEKLKNGKTLADEKMTAVQVLCNNLLPCVELESVEMNIFSKLSGEIKNMFDEFLKLITDTLGSQKNKQETENQSEIVDTNISSALYEEINVSLRNILSLLESAETCVLCMLRHDEAICIGDIASLPEFVMHLVEGTYRHCKESSDVYKDDLNLFSETLSAMFKKSHAIQISFLSLMDRLQLPDTMTTNNVKVLNSVCDGLFKICQTVTALDVKLIVSLWKSISRLLVQYIQFLAEVVDVTAMIIYLCQEIRTGYEYLKQQLPDLEQPDTSWTQVDEKSFQKSVKILGFEMKIILSLCKEYLEYIDEQKCDKEIYELLIFIYKNSPTFTQKMFRVEHREEIDRQIMTACEPLLSSFMDRSIFGRCLLGPINILQEDCLAHLQMVICVTKSFTKLSEESQDFWMGKTKPYQANHDDVIDTVFQLVERCHFELADPRILLPGIMCSGTAQRSVSLYEYLATHINGFIGSLLNKYFPILEKSLLKPIFSSNTFVQMLAIDSWCFMDRYGSSVLCRSHFNFFLDVLKDQCQCYPVLLRDQQLCNLIGRLFRFLEPVDQNDLMSKHSIPFDFLFWCVCPIVAERLQPQEKMIINDVITSCVTQINMWCQSPNQNKHSVSLNAVILACGTLNNILHHIPYTDASKLMPTITESLALIWSFLFDNEWESSLQMDMFLIVLLQLLPIIHLHLSNAKFTEIFVLLKELVENNPSTWLLAELIKLVRSFSLVRFPSEEIPLLLKDILLALLSNQNGLLSHMVVQAVTMFAESTPHGDIVPKCLQTDGNIEPKLVKYINKMLVMDIDLTDFLKSQSSTWKSGKVLSWNDEKNERNAKLKSLEKIMSVIPPSNKRARLDETDEDLNYETLLKNLESDWSALQKLSKSNPVPDWFKNSSRLILEKFQEMCKNVE